MFKKICDILRDYFEEIFNPTVISPIKFLLLTKKRNIKGLWSKNINNVKPYFNNVQVL